MLLADSFKAQGHFLFRWRSYLPFLLLPILAMAMIEAGGELQHLLGKPFEEMLETLSIVVACAGVLLRMATVGFVPKGTSGRNTRSQQADELNTTGLYSVVRNPLYLGNYLVLLGFCIGTEVWWFPLAVSLVFALYYERIIAAEEAYLSEKFGAAYTEWAERTPAFIPDLRLWQRPALPFSFRTVLRREYNGVLLVVVMVVALEVGHDVVAGDVALTSWPSDWPDYFAALGIVGGLCLAIRYLKRNTRLLAVEGRS